MALRILLLLLLFLHVPGAKDEKVRELVCRSGERKPDEPGRGGSPRPSGCIESCVNLANQTHTQSLKNHNSRTNRHPAPCARDSTSQNMSGRPSSLNSNSESRNTLQYLRVFSSSNYPLSSQCRTGSLCPCRPPWVVPSSASPAVSS